MPTIEPHISKYIDSSIVKARKDFNKESNRHMSVLLEKFDNSLAAFREVALKIPTEERIKEIVHEEIRPLDIKLSLCVAEIREHRKELDGHDKRISKLELQAA
jgi:hypothetical protein